MTTSHPPRTREHPAKSPPPTPFALRALVDTGLIAIVLLRVWAWVPAAPPAGACALPRNAAWIGVEWTSEPVDPAAVSTLAHDAAAHHLATLYAYTTYLKADATFNPTFDHAATFVATYKTANPGTDLLAWIGVPLANDRPIGIQGWVDLNDPAQRLQIVNLAADLVTSGGFDGVHLNVETFRDMETSLPHKLASHATLI
jgi:hypothetical protein